MQVNRKKLVTIKCITLFEVYVIIKEPKRRHRMERRLASKRHIATEGERDHRRGDYRYGRKNRSGEDEQRQTKRQDAR